MEFYTTPAMTPLTELDTESLITWAKRILGVIFIKTGIGSDAKLRRYYQVSRISLCLIKEVFTIQIPFSLGSAVESKI